MIRPHPPRLRINRRKTVSVTPAMGARTVAGAMRILPIERLEGTGFAAAAWTRPVVSLSRGEFAPHEPAPFEPFELSQIFFTVLFYLARQNKSPRKARA